MKLLLDENLSPRLVATLPASFKDSVHVLDAVIGRKTDANIWMHARANGFTILTKDSDFAERAVADPGGPKVIWLRVGNCTTEEARRIIVHHEKEFLMFAEQRTAQCLIVR